MSLLACRPSGPKHYQVQAVDRPPVLSGHGDDPLWEIAEVLTDFTYPWRKEKAPATEFRALWDGAWFYFRYRAADDTVISKQEGRGERDVVNSDRVEIFFKSDDRMDPYYSLEMDALGRVLDTEGRFYRKVDFNWNWPEGHLKLIASIDDKGYWVEGAISLESLRQLGMYRDDHLLRTGLYRGEYQYAADGEVLVKWISWVIPDSEKPDFHIPSSFGILELLPKKVQP
ncbi:MAG: carbohydrate-binding family 9-like protein [Saprospiraceae bacterium]|nr:carbohydrate-binding family 9-like protein [Lewinella sp.]